jgi:hypothetical protein
VDLAETGLVLAVVLTGLLVLYTVVRFAVRDGVLDARAKDDAQLAQRDPDVAVRRSRTLGSAEPVDDPAQ